MTVTGGADPDTPGSAGVPLAGRVALVTGGNHGIGAAITTALAALGADVLVTYLRVDASGGDEPPAYARQRAQDADAVVAAVAASGRRAVAVEADLADPDTIAPLFDRAERDLGPVGIVVHNASGWIKDSFAAGGHDVAGRANRAVTPASVDGPLQVDARAGALLMAEFIARLRARGDDWGRIVTMTSGGPGGFPGEVSYGAAKAALVNYTMAAATEMAADGVTANVVHPPVTDTGWVTDELRAFVASGDSDLHHIAEPDDVAQVVAWLCTPAAWLVSGTTITMR